jgi:hypothetical protein
MYAGWAGLGLRVLLGWSVCWRRNSLHGYAPTMHRHIIRHRQRTGRLRWLSLSLSNGRGLLGVRACLVGHGQALVAQQPGWWGNQWCRAISPGRHRRSHPGQYRVCLHTFLPSPRSPVAATQTVLGLPLEGPFYKPQPDVGDPEFDSRQSKTPNTLLGVFVAADLPIEKPAPFMGHW